MSDPSTSTHGPSVLKVALIAGAVLVLVVALAFAVNLILRPSPTIIWSTSAEHGMRERVSEGDGPEHCGWDDTTFLYWGKDGDYVRDEDGRFPGSTPVSFDADATLPPEATFTGWRDGDRELWAEPRDGNMEPTSVYVVSPEGVERWPRFDSGCY